MVVRYMGIMFSIIYIICFISLVRGQDYDYEEDDYDDGDMDEEPEESEYNYEGEVSFVNFNLKLTI